MPLVYPLYTELNPLLCPARSNQMIRQQEIRNPFLNPIFMPTIPTDQHTLTNTRLQQQRVQLRHHLLVLLQFLQSRRILR
jgi:hypothetical protein